MSIYHTTIANLCRLVTIILLIFLRVRNDQSSLFATMLLTPTPTVMLLPKAQVNVPSLNVREGPGIEYHRVTIVSKDDELAVTGQIYNCTWLKIMSPQGIAGWVSAQFVTLNLPCTDLITLLPPSNLAEANITALAAIQGSATIQPSIVLIQPLAPLLRGRVTFEWDSKIALDENQAFELVLWLRGQDPVESGFSPVGARPTTYISINLDQVADDLPQLQPGKDYKWGVLLVSTSPYQRLKFLGADHQFRFERSNPILEPGDTPILTPTPMPIPMSRLTPTPMPTATPPLLVVEPLPTTPSPISANKTPVRTSTPKPTHTSNPSTPKPTDTPSSSAPKPTTVPTEVTPMTPKPTTAPTSTTRPTDVPNTSTPKPTTAPTDESTSTPKPTDEPSTPTPKATVLSEDESPTEEPSTTTP